MRKFDNSVYFSSAGIFAGLVLLSLVYFMPSLVSSVSDNGVIGIVIAIIAAIYFSVIMILKGISDVLE